MNPRQLLLEKADAFRKAGIPDPETDAALLLSSLLNRPPLALRLDTETVLTERQIQAYEALAARRINREPLQYILGTARFHGFDFQVDPRVLIPRPETEALCDWALEILRSFRSPRVLDLCTGSGCIGITLSLLCPEAIVSLSDCSEDALAAAGGNAALLQAPVTLFRSDLFASLPDERFDLIVSNPPYIPSDTCPALQPEVLFEPRLALDGGTDGLALYRRIIRDAAPFLNPSGALLMELGAEEATAVSALLREAGYTDCAVRKDFSGWDRMILGFRP